MQGENKPLACKLFPFSIQKKGEEEALYEYRGNEVYVYVDCNCPNVIIGGNRSIEVLVSEAVQIAFGEKREVELITSPAKTIIQLIFTKKAAIGFL